MFPSGPKRPKGMGFSGFSVQTKKAKDNVLPQYGSKVMGSSSSKSLFKAQEKEESEMYNPFEPTMEPAESHRKQEKKLKKKRKS